MPDLEPRRERYITLITVMVPVVVAIIAGAVTIYQTSLQETMRFQLALEQEMMRHHSRLILIAIETGDPGMSANNLAFLAGAGLLPEPVSQNILTYLEEVEPEAVANVPLGGRGFTLRDYVEYLFEGAHDDPGGN